MWKVKAKEVPEVVGILGAVTQAWRVAPREPRKNTRALYPEECGSRNN